MLAKLQDFPEVEAYLPDARDRHKLPRQWVINVFNTVVGKPFSSWVADVIQERNAQLAVKQDLMIAMDAEIAEVFQQSKSFSSKCQFTCLWHGARLLTPFLISCV